jgi:hypothetical protein
MCPARSAEEGASNDSWREEARRLGHDPVAAVWVLERPRQDGGSDRWSIPFFELVDLEVAQGMPGEVWANALRAYVVHLRIGPRCYDLHTIFEKCAVIRPFAKWAIAEAYASPELMVDQDVERYLRARANGLRQRSGRYPTARYISSITRCLVDFLAYGRGELPGVAAGRSIRGVPVNRSCQRLDRTPPEKLILGILSEAIEMLGAPADDIVRIREKYRVAVEASKAKSESAKLAAGTRGLLHERFSTLPTTGTTWSQVAPYQVREVAKLLRRVQGACIFVIAFACAPRSSEIRWLRKSSLSAIESPYGGVQYALNGYLAKSGRKHSWVACEPVVRAIEVLERLASPLMRIAGDDALFLGGRGAMLWTQAWGPSGIFVTSAGHLNQRLYEFARSTRAFMESGWRGRISMRHGRRSFARFVTMRNKNALGDLAVHFGHLSPRVTDTYYASGDSEYSRLLEEESERDAASVLNEIADAPRIYTNLSTDMERDLRSRALEALDRVRKASEVRRMVGAGAALAPCDWGVCLYKAPTSACKGTLAGPNDVLRTPETCAKCANFVVPPSWQPWWAKRVDDLQRHLALRGVPEQAQRLLQTRLETGLKILDHLRDPCDAS